MLRGIERTRSWVLCLSLTCLIEHACCLFECNIGAVKHAWSLPADSVTYWRAETCICMLHTLAYKTIRRHHKNVLVGLNSGSSVWLGKRNFWHAKLMPVGIWHRFVEIWHSGCQTWAKKNRWKKQVKNSFRDIQQSTSFFKRNTYTGNIVHVK